jgi:hypothetical protein
MKRRIVLVGLFLLSIGAAVGGLMEVVSASPPPCPACNMTELNCPGSPCKCEWVGPGGTDYRCNP